MSAPVSPGELFAGKYRIERELGEGGMGVVVLATHVHLDQKVAIKFLSATAVRDADRLQRFYQEARAAARIQNEHVVRVSDVSQLEDGTPYLVMEYLEGSDLESVVRARGPLPIDEAVDYILQATEAVAEAHVAGIIHRDLKPPNLFVTRRGDGSRLLKVLDFGISKLIPKGAAYAQASITKTRSLMGSPLYMSPEQMRSTRNVSMRSDIWALGIILYEILTAQAPFDGETLPEICAMVLDAPMPSVRIRRPDVPVALDAVIQRCVEKDPDRRFPTAAELAEALAPFARGRAILSVEHIVAVVRGAPEGALAAVGGRGGSSASTGPQLSAASSPALSSPTGPVVHPPDSSAPQAATLAPFGGTGPVPHPKRARWVASIAALVSLVLVGIGVAVALRYRSNPVTSTGSSAPPSAVESVAKEGPSALIPAEPPQATSARGEGLAPGAPLDTAPSATAAGPGTGTATAAAGALAVLSATPSANAVTQAPKHPPHVASKPPPASSSAPKPAGTSVFGRGID
jgi:serine/threonine protein kinase